MGSSMYRISGPSVRGSESSHTAISWFKAAVSLKSGWLRIEVTLTITPPSIIDWKALVSPHRRDCPEEVTLLSMGKSYKRSSADEDVVWGDTFTTMSRGENDSRRKKHTAANVPVQRWPVIIPQAYNVRELARFCLDAANDHLRGLLGECRSEAKRGRESNFVQHSVKALKACGCQLSL